MKNNSEALRSSSGDETETASQYTASMVLSIKNINYVLILYCKSACIKHLGQIFLYRWWYYDYYIGETSLKPSLILQLVCKIVKMLQMEIDILCIYP